MQQLNPLPSLEADLRRALDPAQVLLDAARSATGGRIVAMPWQINTLRNWRRDTLLLCCRQAGKSTIAGALALYLCMYFPEALVLIVGRAERQSAELLRKAKLMYGRLSYAPKLISEAVLHVEFANRSRIIALPGSEETIRGFSAATAVIVDEAAKVDDDLLATVWPMLSTTAGPLWELSTPFGQRGHFYERWHNTKADIQRVKITHEQCPYLHPDFIAKQKAELADWEFRQEWLCEFAATDESVFPTGWINGLFGSTEAPLWIAP